MIPPAESLMGRRMRHQALLDATLKEVFLTHGVQLREPIDLTNKETIVYGGLYRDEEVAVKIFTCYHDDIRDAVSEYGAFKVEKDHDPVASTSVDVQVMEYGDADLPDDMPQELREFFPLGLVPFMITERASYGSLDQVLAGANRPGFDRISLMRSPPGDMHTGGGNEHEAAHRDDKPQNILVFGPAEGKIADFGVARWRSQQSLRNRLADAPLLFTRMRDPRPDRQARGPGRDRGDIYSWAIVSANS